jgi:hypothetical protein
MASTIFRGSRSPLLIIQSGVPQGSVLSPALFNAFFSDLPQVSSLTEAYADDINIGEFSPDIPTVSAALTDYLNHVVQWAEDKNLTIAPSKSSVTLFMSDWNQSNVHPQVYLNGVLLHLNKFLKNLGTNFDLHVVYNVHGNELHLSGSKFLSLLKALSGTSWGQDFETLLLTWKTLGKPAINHNDPIWKLNISATTVAKLQVIQNHALRLATGCHKRTRIEHLHQETRELHLDSHLNLLCSQFLANALTPAHPSHNIVTQNTESPRTLKKNLYQHSIDDVRPYLKDGIVPESQYKKRISKLHIDAVSAEISSNGPNPILGFRPPEVSAAERLLNTPPNSSEKDLGKKILVYS